MKMDKAKQAITAAIDLFGQQGFDNTSTQSIAKHAGIGNATLFKYFESKDVLIREAYLAAKKDLIACIKQGLDPTLSFEPMLRAIWLNFFSWCLEKPMMYSFVCQIASSRFHDAQVEELVDSEMLFFKMAISSAKSNQQIADLPLEVIQGTIMAFINLAVQFHTEEPIVGESVFYNLMLNSLEINQTQKEHL